MPGRHRQEQCVLQVQCRPQHAWSSSLGRGGLAPRGCARADAEGQRGEGALAGDAGALAGVAQLALGLRGHWGQFESGKAESSQMRYPHHGAAPRHAALHRCPRALCRHGPQQLTPHLPSARQTSSSLEHTHGLVLLLQSLVGSQKSCSQAGGARQRRSALRGVSGQAGRDAAARPQGRQGTRGQGWQACHTHRASACELVALLCCCVAHAGVDFGGAARAHGVGGRVEHQCLVRHQHQAGLRGGRGTARAAQLAVQAAGAAGTRRLQHWSYAAQTCVQRAWDPQGRRRRSRLGGWQRSTSRCWRAGAARQRCSGRRAGRPGCPPAVSTSARKGGCVRVADCLWPGSEAASVGTAVGWPRHWASRAHQDANADGDEHATGGRLGRLQRHLDGLCEGRPGYSRDEEQGRREGASP